MIRESNECGILKTNKYGNKQWKQHAFQGGGRELERSGELDTLLRGEKTKVMPLSLVLLGVDVVMDATLQLVRKDGEPLIEILGVNPSA